MCENCRAQRTETMAEIAQLASGEGALYDSLVEIVEETAADVAWTDDEGNALDPDFARNELLQATLAEQIAVRAAFCAHFSDLHTEEGGLPIPIILGAWAGHAMNYEMAISRRRSLMDHLGMNQN